MPKTEQPVETELGGSTAKEEGGDTRATQECPHTEREEGGGGHPAARSCRPGVGGGLGSLLPCRVVRVLPDDDQHAPHLGRVDVVAGPGAAVPVTVSVPFITWGWISQWNV